MDNIELNKLVTEQAVDDNLCSVKNPDEFAKFVFDRVASCGNINTQTLMVSLDKIIKEYREKEKSN